MNMRLSCNDTRIENATWPDVEAALPELKEEAFFRLSIIPKPKIGPSFLEIESEGGHYMPSMLIIGQPEDRLFVNLEARDKPDVSIGGYTYDAMAVTQDFDLIVRMITEFYETGDVSKDLLK
ncbi:MAG: hypothetical protein DELT_03120 [Desulfovibrio sp.]